jgi:hypothetical protein
LKISDDNGNTLFHFAVGCLDDSAILKLMEKGAPLMRRNWAEVSIDDDDDEELFEVRFAGINYDEATLLLRQGKASSGATFQYTRRYDVICDVFITMRRFSTRDVKEELQYNATLEPVGIQGSIHKNATLASVDVMAVDIVSVDIAPPHPRN